MAISEKNNNMAEAQDDSLQLKDLLALCIGKWKWFVLTLNSYAVADEIDYRFEELIRAINAEIAYSKEQYEALKKKNASDRDKASGGSNGGGGSQGGNTPAPQPGGDVKVLTAKRDGDCVGACLATWYYLKNNQRPRNFFTFVTS